MIAISRERKPGTPLQPSTRNQYPPDAPLGTGLSIARPTPYGVPVPAGPAAPTRSDPSRRRPSSPGSCSPAAAPHPHSDRDGRHADRPHRRRAPRPAAAPTRPDPSPSAANLRRPIRCGCPGRPPTRPRRRSCSARWTPGPSRGCSTRPRSRCPTRRAAYGWTQAEAQPRPDGHTVDVAEGGQKLTLSLTQPGRAGAGGIWVVTAESPRLTAFPLLSGCAGAAAGTAGLQRHADRSSLLRVKPPITCSVRSPAQRHSS